MADFFKDFVRHSSPPAPRHTPEGKLGVMSKIEIGRGKGITIVREDILQKGLSRKR